MNLKPSLVLDRAHWRHGLFLALATIVLATHVALLRVATGQPEVHAGQTVSLPAPLRFQLVLRPAPPVASTAAPALPAVVQAPIARPSAGSALRVVARAARPAAPSAATGVAAVPAVPMALAQLTSVPLSSASASGGTVGAEAALEGADVPVYATAIPASLSLHFVLQRGAAVGLAELHWRRHGDEYGLVLEGALQGVPVLSSVSTGRIDADGVAPLRHTERKRSRDVRAANFRRDSGVISFSGPDGLVPLPAGAQDRLSWLVQLPAIVEANPALRVAGARVTLFVVGTRGDAQPWHFQVQGHETLDVPGGLSLDALRLLREPSRPFDTRAEVWLDPARQHLPARAVFTTLPGGQPLEMQLSQVVAQTP